MADEFRVDLKCQERGLWGKGFQQDLGDGSGACPEFDHRPGLIDRQAIEHGAGEVPRTWSDGGDVLKIARGCHSESFEALRPLHCLDERALAGRDVFHHGFKHSWFFRDSPPPEMRLTIAFLLQAES